MPSSTCNDRFQLLVGWDPGYRNGKAVMIVPAIHRGPFETKEQAASWLDEDETSAEGLAPSERTLLRGPDDWTAVPRDGPDALPRPTWYIGDPSSTVERIAVVPSVTGSGSTELGLLSAGRLTRSRKPSMPERIRFGRKDYLVGDGVGHWAVEEQRMDFERLSDSPQLRTLFYATLFRLLAAQADQDGTNFLGGTPELRLVVGLPVEVMANRKRGTETLRAMRNWMIGDHRFLANNRPAAIHVSDVQAMAQPAGTVFAFCLDNRGAWARDKQDLKAPIAVCDIGFRTLDLFAVAGGRVEGRYTGGDGAGMSRAAQYLIDALGTQHAVDGLSLHAADSLLHEPHPSLWMPGGQQVDLEPLVQEALDRAARAVSSFVERKWGEGRTFAYLLFTGGGAFSLRDRLEQRYPHGIFLPNAVTSNALGLARYAQRLWG